MKKWLTVALALLLVLAFSSLALADLYDDYGDLDDWDEGTWELAEAWTDDQWEEYWNAYEAAWEARYEEERRERRAAMGLPYLEGANVNVNGHYLDFGPDQPVVLDGVLMLPLRPFFDYLGADTSYSNGVTTVSLPDGRRLELETGVANVTLIRNDGSSVDHYLWAEPQIIQGKLYMPYDVLTDALDFDYSRNYSYDIYYLTDRVSLVAELNQHYTLVNAALAMERLSGGENLAVTGKLGLSGMLYGETDNDSALVEVRYAGVTDGALYDFSAELVIDISDLEDTLLTLLDEEDWQIIELLRGATAEVIFNLETNTMYIKSPLLSYVDDNLDGATWLKVEQAAPSELISPQLTVGDLIYDMSYSYYGSRYEDAWETHEALLAMFGDASFTSRSSGSRTTYSLKLDSEDALGLGSSYGYGGLSYLLYYMLPFGYYGTDSAMLHSIEIVEQDGEIVSIDLEIQVTTEGLAPVTYRLKAALSDTAIELGFQVDGRYVGKFSIYYEEQATPSTQAPQSAPPEGERVLDMVDLYMMRYPALYEDYSNGYNIPEPMPVPTAVDEEEAESAALEQEV